MSFTQEELNRLDQPTASQFVRQQSISYSHKSPIHQVLSLRPYQSYVTRTIGRKPNTLEQNLVPNWVRIAEL
ncbi:6837_t:CDS:2, partial [Acaulospora colombiana]